MDNAVLGSIRTLKSIVDIQNNIKDMKIVLNKEIARIKSKSQKRD